MYLAKTIFTFSRIYILTYIFVRSVLYSAKMYQCVKCGEDMSKCTWIMRGLPSGRQTNLQSVKHTSQKGNDLRWLIYIYIYKYIYIYIHTYIYICMYIYTYTYTYTHTYTDTYLLLFSMLWHRQAIFKPKGDKLCSSAECRIWTRGPRHQIASRLNARWQTDWAIEDQAKKLELDSPSLRSASIQPTWPHCQLTFAPGSGDIHICCY